MGWKPPDDDDRLRDRRSDRTTTIFRSPAIQPKFIIDQVRSACKFEGITPQFRPDLVVMALDNLYTKDTPGYRNGFSLQNLAAAAAAPARAA